MMRRFIPLAAALLCTVSGAAMAQQTRGYYVGGAVGGSFLQDVSPRGGGADRKAEFNTGYVGLLDGGYGFGNGFRAELEFGYRRNDVDKIFGSATKSGAIGAYSYMVNGLYDFDLSSIGLPSYIVPHVGGGLGAVTARFSDARFFNGHTVSGQDTQFAYQGIIGADYALTPHLKIGLDYHYLATNALRFKTELGQQTKSTLQDHEVLLALRYEFGAPAPAPVVAPPPPPPPPPPAPAPQLQRAFQVFFDFDKSDITAAAQKVIQQAAQSIKQGNLTRINVTGHTDTVGSAKYNQALSERRAAAVKQALVTEGVGANDIVTRGVGKTDLLVPTGDGVREPQNRRAEIVLQ